jgi:hypothetical protein
VSDRDSGTQGGFDARYAPVFQPGFVGDDDGDPRALGIGAPVQQPGAPADGQAAGRPPVRRRRLVDRFVVAIWLVGAALITVGVSGVTGLMLGSDRGPSEITPDYMILVIVTQVSPWLIATGLATLIGTLFLLAARWERRP